MKCPHCQSDLPSQQCPQCGEETPLSGNFCCHCGSSVAEGDTTSQNVDAGEEYDNDEIDFSERTLCSDGNCIGVINKNGVCNECGKPYTGETDEA
jgi:hypothetical protein